MRTKRENGFPSRSLTRPLPGDERAAHPRRRVSTYANLGMAVARGRFPADLIIDGVRVRPRVLGRGAYAIVQEALWRGTLVAVKTLHQILVEEGVPGRDQFFREFVREWDTLKSLRHPCIVQFLGVCALEDDRNNHGLVTELLACTLRGRYEGEPCLSYRQIVDVGNDIASALAYLHGLGIIHRDVTTSNVLLTDWSATRAKLADVGVSRHVPRGSAAEMLTACPGAQIYMAPEALEVIRRSRGGDRGERARYGPKADVFSMGLVLFFFFFFFYLLKPDPSRNGANCGVVWWWG